MNVILRQANKQRVADVVEYTNLRLNDWYENAKDNYGVIGSASCEFLNDEFETLVINYEENGIKCRFEVNYSLEYDKNYAFEIWAENANPENDKLN